MTLPRLFQTSESWLINPLLFVFRNYPASFIFILNFISFSPYLFPYILIFFPIIAAEKWPLIEKGNWLKSPSSYLAQSGGWWGGRSSGSMFQSTQPPRVLGLSSGQGEPCNCMCVLCHWFVTSIQSSAVQLIPSRFFLLWEDIKPCWDVAPQTPKRTKYACTMTVQCNIILLLAVILWSCAIYLHFISCKL